MSLKKRVNSLDKIMNGESTMYIFSIANIRCKELIDKEYEFKFKDRDLIVYINRSDDDSSLNWKLINKCPIGGN